MTGERTVRASGQQSVAAGHSIGSVFTGNGAAPMFVERMQAALPAEAFELPEAEAGVVNLPFRARHFVGRDHELALLDRAFKETGEVVVHAVHGLGGIGKSTLAARWAAGRTALYNPVWWITAETEADLDAGLADFAVGLQPALRDLLSRTALRDLAVRWLSEHEGWLLVLDNVSEPADVKGLVGRATGGRILITTRQAAGWRGIAETLSLDVLELPAAVDLFTRIYGSTAAETEELCRELGCLPLAVEQAAAYCREAAIEAGEFLRQLAAHPAQTLSNAPEGGRAVARIWPVTLDRLADTPLAGEILRVIGWWAPDGIRREFLEPMGSPPEVTEALRRLAAHSMISLHGDTISVHRLVQAVGRAGDPVGARDSAAELLQEWADRHPGDLSSGWLTHAETLVGLTGPETKPVAALLVSIAIWHHDFNVLQDDAEAREWAERAEAATRRTCERGDGDARDARRVLVAALVSDGDWKAALALQRAIVADSVRTSGRRAPETFTARAELATMVFRGGDVKGALRGAKRNLRRAERVLGADHPTVIDVGSILIDLYDEMVRAGHDGYAPEGIAYGRRLQAHAEKVAGENDLNRAATTSGLIDILYSAGDKTGALAMLKPFAEQCARGFGELNIRTLHVRARLVDLMRETGDLESAREQARSLLPSWERAVGETSFQGYAREHFADLLAQDED